MNGGNLDGIADIVVFGFDLETPWGYIAVLLGNGDGTFRTATRYMTGCAAGGYFSVFAADFNGDHKPDALVSCGNTL